MKVIIVEDEDAAYLRLKKILLEIDPTIEIVSHLDSIAHSVTWLKDNAQPDLIFADIQLGDGPSFEIFSNVKINVPVVFITAYDAYALDKFRQFAKTQAQPAINYEEILTLLSSRTPAFQKRIVVRIGQSIRTIEIADVAYFYTEEKIAFACLTEGKRLPLDFTLDELETILDPALFFRINRQFIIYIKAIENMFSYSKSRIKIILKPHSDAETIVSAERSAAFKEWLLGKS
jgi:DNA-binding LytR/AlgR family response regulator